MTAMSVGLALIGLLIAGLLAWIGLNLSRRKAADNSTAQLEAAQLTAGAKSRTP